MSSLTIIKAGAYTTIQDNGRSSVSYYAIPQGGALLKSAIGLGNIMLGVSEDNPAIECLLIPPTILFKVEMNVVLTGAKSNWKLDGESIPCNQVLKVSPGQTLSGTPFCEGWIGYICLDHQMISTKSYESYSTYPPARYGGNNGNILKLGDSIELQYLEANILNVKVRLPESQSQMLMLEGPDLDLISEDDRDKICVTAYKISSTSNRMGLRLDGLALSCKYQLNESVPVYPGIVQLTPSGQLIVVLYDGQTTGGYPRVGYIDDHNLQLLLMHNLGSRVNFDFHKNKKA